MPASKQVELTSGAIADIINKKTVTNGLFQILNYKKIENQGGEKYRVILSDGVHSHTSTVLNSAHNEMVISGEISSNCVIKITRYSTTFQKGKTIIVVNDLDVVARGEDVGSVIGQPVSYKVAESENVSPYNKNAASNSSSDAKPTTPKKAKTEMHSIAEHNQNVSSPSKRVQPICNITPYQNRWMIRARVTSKTPLKTYSNSRGAGQLFSIVLTDESGEIRVTFYNDECERFLPEIQQGKVYQVSNCAIKPANRQYTSVKNDYEMAAQPDSQFFLCDDDNSIPAMEFTFTKIEAFNQTVAGYLTDVIGVVLSVGDLTQITTKQGKELQKREIEIGDETGYKIILTLWQDEAQKFDGKDVNVMAVKNVKVSDFGGRALSTTFESNILTNPDMTEAYTLTGWYSRVKDTIEFKDFKSMNTRSEMSSGGKWMTLYELKKSINADSDSAQWATVMVYLAQTKYRDGGLYKACAECKKKLQTNDDNELFCEKCCKVQNDFKWNMIMSVELVDPTDSVWATSFADSSEMFIGKSAREIGELREQSDQGASDIESIVQGKLFYPYIVGLKIQMEIYNDESRPKVSITSCKPCEPVSYARKLIQDINAMKM